MASPAAPQAAPPDPLPAAFAFHHVGVACEQIAAEAQAWQLLGYRPEGGPFVDSAQGIRGLFMVGGGPRLELLEPLAGSATLAPWLRRRVKLYHVGYQVPSIEEAIEHLAARGATVTRAPLMSAYFGALVAFLMMPNLALVEVIGATA